jgi:hypothetical protein
MPKAFDDGQRSVVTELHGSGADANRVGGGGNLANQHRGLRARDSHKVMFCDPKPLVSPAFGMPGEVDRVAESGRGVAAFADRRKVED